MSGPFGSSQWMYSSGGFYPTEIEQSLRFNDNDSAYLSRTPASAGNRKTWTWSGWVKRGNIDINFPALFGCFVNGTNYFLIRFNDSTDVLQVIDKNAGTNNLVLTTNATYRDTSSWYHIVLSVDTTAATSTDRAKLYVNGEQVTSFSATTYPSQNFDTYVNTANQHNIGSSTPVSSTQLFDGYLGEVNFIDGQALDPTSFGEFKSGVWVANEYTGSYGTNGFYLPFKQTTVANGFNTVLYTGNGSSQSIEGVGFSPDLVWLKSRSSGYNHALFDSVRGVNERLQSNSTDAEATRSDALNSFDADGFTVGGEASTGLSGETYAAWCWDAGSGSPVSNTDGSITSSVKANPAYGFSVVGYTGTGSNATVGHGLGAAPEMIILKDRDGTDHWRVYTSTTGATKSLYLSLTNAAATDSTIWNNTAPTSSVFTIGNDSGVNTNTNDYIAYCFAEISGYSSFGSYSGTGASGNTVTTGFKPAFVMIKRTDSAENWIMYDNTRAVTNPIDKQLLANSSNSEINGYSPLYIDFNSNGFTINGTNAGINASGGTYIYMAFADTRDAAFWRDLSGNDNTWQPNALQNSDVMPDSPTNNFCTLNPTFASSSLGTNVTLAEGNLAKLLGQDQFTASTMAVSSGKYYCEFYLDGTPGNVYMGLINADSHAFHLVRHTGDTSGAGNFTTSPTFSTYTNADVIGMAYDADNNKFYFAINGTWQNSADPAAGTGGLTPNASGPMYFGGRSQDGQDPYFNFGQDSSFAGNKTPQGNTDDNGVSDFYYAPPSGYLALCTANLPDPVIDPAQDDVPSDYFNTVLYTGNLTTGHSITGVGFQPDWVWIKNRTDPRDHVLTDAVRGATIRLQSNTTDAEVTQAEDLQSFDADGFTVGSQNRVNESGDAFVSWNWLAGNGTSSNTDGSITSTVSVNQKAGFSVVGYTGTGATSSGVTIGHGLGETPAMIITKKRTGGTDYGWSTWHKDLGGNYGIWLDKTSARNPAMWDGYTNISSTVFSPPNLLYGNESGADYINYLFAEVEGYSKFGSYTGNGSTDGPFVHCGFRPAWVMIKETSGTGDWHMYDVARNPYNLADEKLRANTSGAETVNAADSLDFVSNGIKLRNNGSAFNASGDTYIFMAFAELPAKYSLGR